MEIKQCILLGKENIMKNNEQIQYVGIRSLNIEIITVQCNLGIFIDRKMTIKKSDIKHR